MIYISRFSNIRPYLHILAPSLVGVIVGFLFAAVIVGFHLIALSGQSGSDLPIFLGDEDSRTFFELAITQWQSFFNNSILNKILGGLLWGAIGFIIFSMVEKIISVTRQWQIEKRDVNVGFDQRLIKHPGLAPLLNRLAWRLGVILVSLFITGLLSPLISSLLNRDQTITTSQSAGQALTTGLVNVIAWFFIIQLYIVLLRLFLLRTKVFGEILY